MSLYQSMRNQPALWAGVAVVFLGVAVTSTLTRSKPAAKPQFSRIWFYDLGTGKLFAAANDHPPIDAPSGAGQGVVAFIYACGACEPASWTFAYIQTFTPQAKTAMQQPSDTPEQLRAKQAASTAGRLVALPPSDGEKPRWTPSNSAAAAAILARAQLDCPSPQRATLCQP